MSKPNKYSPKNNIAVSPDGKALFWRPNGGGGNYDAKLQRFVAEHPELKGSVVGIDVLHDGCCAIFQGQSCNCDPEISMRRGQ